MLTARGTPADMPHVIVCGTRTFADYPLLKSKMDALTADLGPLVVVTGEWRGVGYGTPGYIGADLLGEQWASSVRAPVVQFPPEFDKFPKGSPGPFHQRNREMVQFVAGLKHGYAAVFYDGKSPGTASMIQLLKQAKVEFRVTRY